VAFWLSKKYRVAPEPLAALVTEAYEIGKRTKLDPTLIPPSSPSSPASTVCAKLRRRTRPDAGDDQRAHRQVRRFWWPLAAFDPVPTCVGVKVLQECIARAGSLEGGLRYYVGAANLPHDGGYAAKVLAISACARWPDGPRLPPPVLSTKAPAATGGRPNSQVCRRKSGPARQRRLNSRRWREAPSATLAGHATGDRRKAHRLRC
jgi:hypothetical protein